MSPYARLAKRIAELENIQRGAKEYHVSRIEERQELLRSSERSKSEDRDTQQQKRSFESSGEGVLQKEDLEFLVPENLSEGEEGYVPEVESQEYEPETEDEIYAQETEKRESK